MGLLSLLKSQSGGQGQIVQSVVIAGVGAKNYNVFFLIKALLLSGETKQQSGEPSFMLRDAA